MQLSKTSEQHRALEKQLRQDIQAAQSAATTARLEVALKRSKEVRVATDVRPKRKRSKQ